MLSCIKDHPGITLSELVVKTGQTHTYVRRFLQYERQKGIVDTEQVGNEWRNYVTLRTLPGVGPAIRTTVVDAIQKHGPISVSDIATVTRASIRTIRRTLRDLKAAGRVTYSTTVNNERRWRITQG